MTTEVTRHFFTFGNTAYRQLFVEVHVRADDPDLKPNPIPWEIARGVMWELHGRKWGFQYTEEEFAPHPERFGLKRLSLIVRNEHNLWTAVEVMGEN